MESPIKEPKNGEFLQVSIKVQWAPEVHRLFQTMFENHDQPVIETPTPLSLPNIDQTLIYKQL